MSHFTQGLFCWLYLCHNCEINNLMQSSITQIHVRSYIYSPSRQETCLVSVSVSVTWTVALHASGFWRNNSIYDMIMIGAINSQYNCIIQTFTLFTASNSKQQYKDSLNSSQIDPNIKVPHGICSLMHFISF